MLTRLKQVYGIKNTGLFLLTGQQRQPSLIQSENHRKRMGAQDAALGSKKSGSYFLLSGCSADSKAVATILPVSASVYPFFGTFKLSFFSLLGYIFQGKDSLSLDWSSVQQSTKSVWDLTVLL